MSAEDDVETEGSTCLVEEDLTTGLAVERPLHLHGVELFGGQHRDSRAGEEGLIDRFGTMFKQDDEHRSRVHQFDRAASEVSSFGGERKVSEVDHVTSDLAEGIVDLKALPIGAIALGSAVEDLAFPTGGKADGYAV